MNSDIKSLIATCPSCQKSKPRLKKIPGRLRPIPIAPKVSLLIKQNAMSP